MKQFDFEEWTRLGEYYFGDDFKNWRFICPKCGTIQSLRTVNINTYPANIYKQCFASTERTMRRTRPVKCDYKADKKDCKTVVLIAGEYQPVFEFFEGYI